MTCYLPGNALPFVSGHADLWRRDWCVDTAIVVGLGKHPGETGWLIGRTAGAGRRCQPYPLSVLTWLEVCLFLEAAGAAPSQCSLFRPLCAHLTPCDLRHRFPFVDFFLSQRCLLLLDQNVSPSVCSAFQFPYCFPAMLSPIPCWEAFTGACYRPAVQNLSCQRKLPSC